MANEKTSLVVKVNRGQTPHAARAPSAPRMETLVVDPTTSKLFIHHFGAAAAFARRGHLRRQIAHPTTPRPPTCPSPYPHELDRRRAAAHEGRPAAAPRPRRRLPRCAPARPQPIVCHCDVAHRRRHVAIPAAQGIGRAAGRAGRPRAENDQLQVHRTHRTHYTIPHTTQYHTPRTTHHTPHGRPHILPIASRRTCC